MKQFKKPGGMIVSIKFCELLEQFLQDFNISLQIKWLNLH